MYCKDILRLDENKKIHIYIFRTSETDSNLNSSNVQLFLKLLLCCKLCTPLARLKLWFSYKKTYFCCMDIIIKMWLQSSRSDGIYYYTYHCHYLFDRLPLLNARVMNKVIDVLIKFLFCTLLKKNWYSTGTGILDI